MHSRFTSNLALATLGAFLVPVALAFGTANVGWIALGVGVAAVVIALVGFATLDRGGEQRRLDVLVLVLGVCTVVGSRVFDGHVLAWTTFGLGCALAALSALGLVLHEQDAQRRLAALTSARVGRDGTVADAGRLVAHRSTEVAA